MTSCGVVAMVGLSEIASKPPMGSIARSGRAGQLDARRTRPDDDEGERLPPPGGVFVVAAVGTPGARDDIRTKLLPRGYTEGTDFLFLA